MSPRMKSSESNRWGRSEDWVEGRPVVAVGVVIISLKQCLEKFVTLGPVGHAGVGIDVSVSADADEAAAPVPGEKRCPLRADVIVIGAGYDDRGKGQGVEGHRHKTRCSGGIGWGFGVAWGYEKGGFDRSLIVFRPPDDGAAGKTMTDEDHVFWREGGEDLVDGMEPVGSVRCVPIPLMDTGIAVELLPMGLPMTGTGIVETRQNEAVGW